MSAVPDPSLTPVGFLGGVRRAIGERFASIGQVVRNLQQFSARERIDWYENMAELRRAKVTTESALETIAGINSAFKRPAAKVYNAMLPFVRRGQSIDAAAKPFVPGPELLLLAAGDRAASPDGYDAAARMLRALRDMRATLFKHLTYPLALLIFGGAVIFTYATKIVPVAKSMPNFAELKVTIRAFVTFADFYTENIAWIVAVAAVLAIATLLALPRWTGRGRALADRYAPPFILYRYYTAAVFLNALGALLRTDMGVDSALKHMYERAAPYLRRHLEPTILTYRKGDNEAAAFNTGLLDHNLVIRITAMSRSGSLRDALRQMGDDVVAYTQRIIATVGATTAGAILLVMVLFIMWAVTFSYELGFAAADSASRSAAP